MSMRTVNPREVRILIIDDDWMQRRAIERCVRGLGFIPEFPGSGQTGTKGMESALRRPPHVIVLDVMLSSGPNGWEVCHYLRSCSQLDETGIIFVSGIGHKLLELHASMYGADGFLDKPCDLPQLGVLIERVLASRCGLRIERVA